MNSRLRRPAGALLATAVATTVFGIVPTATALVGGGTISGTVTNVGGDAVPNVEVQTFELIAGEWEATDAAFTDSQGDYSLPLAVGDYRVGFREGSEYVEEFFDDAATVETATTIPVTDGSMDVADAELVEYSHITGVVTDASGAPYAGVGVFALVNVGGEWDFAAEVYTDATGSYSLDGLVADTYRVEFEASTGEQTGIYEAWNNKGRLEDADDIVVGSEATVSAINAQLIAGEHDPDPFLEGVTIPMITGTPQVGSTLSVTAGTWEQGEVSATYQWFNDDGAIAGATATTYVPTATDVGKSLVVIVEASKPGFQNRFNMSNTVGPIVAAAAATPPPVVAPAPAPAPAPVVLSFSKKIDVVGALKVGSTLKLKNFKALVSRTTVTYKIQWYAGSKKIKKATRSKLKVTKAMKGKKIFVKVTAISGTTRKTVKVKVGKIR